MHMSCKEIEECLSSYLDGEISPEGKARVEQHVARCPACSSLLQEWQSQAMLLQEAISSIPSPAEMESHVLQKLENIDLMRQKGPILHVLAVSSLCMGLLSCIWVLTPSSLLLWSVAHVSMRLLGGLSRLVVRLVAGQGWMILSIVLLAVLLAGLSLAGIRQILRGKFLMEAGAK